MPRIEKNNGIVSIFAGDAEVLRHSASSPLLELGQADFHFRSTEGGLHRIHNPVRNWLALRGGEVQEQGLRLFEGEISVELVFESKENAFSFSLNLPQGYNYARVNFPARREEAVYGGGVQFSHLNLRGRRFPIWTSEMGLGRHPLRPYTWLANLIAAAGGEYWNAYFPQPSFLSTRGYGCLLDTGGYSLMDFSQAGCHRVEILGGGRLHIFSGGDLRELVGRLSNRTGIMPEPPRWVFEGGLLGIQGGLPYVRETVDRVLSAGAKITGIWTQDWAGVRIFWQGKRLFWNWAVNDELYPDLREEIKRRSEQGIRWLTYLNPYFQCRKRLFQDRQGQWLFG